MKSNKGITLVMLVITVVILAILAGSAINVGYSTFKNSELTGYVTTMNMIQSRVNVISQKVTEGDTSYNDIGIDFSQLDTNTQEKINKAVGGKVIQGFKYYDKEQLELLGLPNIEEVVIINLTTKEIYSLIPIEYKNEEHYNQYNLPNGLGNPTKTESSKLQTEKPQFTIEKNNYGLTCEVSVTNIIYAPGIRGANIYYGEVTDLTTNPVTVSSWKQVEGTSFSVTKTSIYAVKVVDKNGGEEIKTVNVVTCNSPEITSGMVPVIYDNGNWKKVPENEMGKWYDYSEGKWANVMLSDGIVIEDDGTISTMGSMFVWIPRYAYQITSEYHNGGEGISGNINVKFLKDLSNITTDEKTTKMINESGKDKWNVHPAFTNESENNYENGGWDRELAGFWVAKFEASSSSPEANYGGGNVTNLSVKVLPNVTSWRKITITNCYSNCLNMNKTGNIYGIPSNAVTHLMKNSEWGAVAYLTQSKYGRAGVEVTINNSTNYITGNAGNAVSDTKSTSGVVNAYNTAKGNLASTTGTVYGIYDMSGGAHDIVASATIDVVDTSIITGSNKLFNIVEKSTDNTGVENYKLVSDKYGDATYEVSLGAYDGANETTNKKSWNNDYNSFVSKDYPVDIRGGSMESSKNAGLFAFYRNSSAANNGTGSETLSFRPTIVIE